MKNKPRVIVVCGPTAAGKSDFAVDLAIKIDGEVISADSRQVYTGMDIGSGKITEEEMRGVPHHMLDIRDPKKNAYSVFEYKKDAEKIIEEIISRGKIPIICGGTGLYIDSLIFDMDFPEVEPNIPLRKKLEKKSTEELQKELKEKDPERYKNIDIQNRVRLIRSLEIVNAIDKVPKTSKGLRDDWNIEIYYLLPEKEIIKERIDKRLERRIDSGMIDEIESLRKEGVSDEKLYSFGLEYRYVMQYITKELSKEEMLDKLKSEIYKYAKRQITWFNKYLPFIK